jgi:RimJ/RimL family protein N-acetyltransferase
MTDTESRISTPDASTLRIARLDRSQVNRVAHLTLRDDQTAFSLPPATALMQDCPFDHFMIRASAEVVGYFRIDRAYPDHMGFALPDEPGLRAFSIGAAFQGRGLATAACRLLGSVLGPLYPQSPSVALTVNCANPAAIRCYLAGGFADTGALYHGGRAGPQHILRKSLSDHWRAAG